MPTRSAAVTPARPIASSARFAIITAIVCAVGLIACYLPARRAVALDPVHALRN